MTINPYDPPQTIAPLCIDRESAIPAKAVNPAKALLLLFGWFYIACAPIGFLLGILSDSRLMTSSGVVFLLACGTIWMANRDFTLLMRATTIIWGLCLFGFFLTAIFLGDNWFGASASAFFIIELFFAAPIPVLAVRGARPISDGWKVKLAEQSDELEVTKT